MGEIASEMGLLAGGDDPGEDIPAAGQYPQVKSLYKVYYTAPHIRALPRPLDVLMPMFNLSLMATI